MEVSGGCARINGLGHEKNVRQHFDLHFLETIVYLDPTIIRHWFRQRLGNKNAASSCLTHKIWFSSSFLFCGRKILLLLPTDFLLKWHHLKLSKKFLILLIKLQSYYKKLFVLWFIWFMGSAFLSLFTNLKLSKKFLILLLKLQSYYKKLFVLWFIWFMGSAFLSLFRAGIWWLTSDEIWWLI